MQEVSSKYNKYYSRRYRFYETHYGKNKIDKKCKSWSCDHKVFYKRVTRTWYKPIKWLKNLIKGEIKTKRRKLWGVKALMWLDK